jgi:periplasmic protein TonB
MKTIAFLLIIFTATDRVAALGQGKLLGQVTDEGGSPVGGATVSILGNGTTQAAVSNAQGYYVFLAIPEGSYMIRSAKRGLPNWQKQIAIAAGTMQQINIQFGVQEETAADAASKQRTGAPVVARKVESKTELADAQLGKTAGVNLSKALQDALAEAEALQSIDETSLIPDEEPEIIGGQQALYKNLVYPATAERAKIEGQVVAKVYLDENGTLLRLSLLKTAHPLLNNEVLRTLIEEVKFKPARSSGKPVKSTMTLPVKFQVK